MTLEEFTMATTLEPPTEPKLPEQYELIDGEVVEVQPMGVYSSEVANSLHDELAVYAKRTRLGRSRMDMIFRLPLRRDANRNRKPDVSFISFERWPADREIPYRGNPMNVVPELMVEVISPTDEAEEVLKKAFEYLQAGARLVWLIYPSVRTVQAYTSPDQPPRVFSEESILDAGDVLPGFTVPVAALFPPVIGLPEGKSDE